MTHRIPSLAAGLSVLATVAVSVLLAGPASAEPPAPTGFVTLGGRVWADANANGIQEPGEPGVAGVTVIVDWGLGPAFRVTDADGRYSVDNVAAGRATTVFFTAPDGQVFSPQAAPGSTSSTDSDPNESGTVLPASYPDGTVRLDIDAGVHAPEATTTTTTQPAATSTVPAVDPVPTVPASSSTTAPAATPTTVGSAAGGPATTAPGTPPTTAPADSTPTTDAPVVAGIAITAPVSTTEPATAVLGTSTARALARTGTDAWRSLLPVATLLLGLGCLLVGASRRLTRAR